MTATIDNALENTRIIRDAVDASRVLRRFTATVEQCGDSVSLQVKGDEDDVVTKGTTREAINTLICLCVTEDRLVDVLHDVCHSGNFADVWVRNYTLAQCAQCCRRASQVEAE